MRQDESASRSAEGSTCCTSCQTLDFTRVGFRTFWMSAALDVTHSGIHALWISPSLYFSCAGFRTFALFCRTQQSAVAATVIVTNPVTIVVGPRTDARYACSISDPASGGSVPERRRWRCRRAWSAALLRPSKCPTLKASQLQKSTAGASAALAPKTSARGSDKPCGRRMTPPCSALLRSPVLAWHRASQSVLRSPGPR